MKTGQAAIKISSVGTGSTDGLASQLLCKLNAVMFASYYDYEYVEIPFDDSYIKGNSGHRFGPFSTALQNTIFTFPGFEKINPLLVDYARIKTIKFTDVPKSVHGHADRREYIKNSIESDNFNHDIFIINGFANLFNDKPYLYNKISRGRQLLVEPSFINKTRRLSDVFKICVHIRRGDIMRHDIHSSRIIPVKYFDKILSNVEKLLRERRVPFKVHLHSEDFGEPFDHDVHRFPEINPINSFFDFFDADLIISSKSSHSNVPGLLCGNLMICPADSWFAPLPHWIKADVDGEFDIERFRMQLANYL